MKKRNLRFFVALWTAKLSYRALRILGRDASHFPGVLALKFCPDFLARVGKPDTIVAVTGTNGKTTVTNMIYNLLSDSGEKVLCNHQGSNTYTGIASILLIGTALSGKSKYKTAVFEVDERSSKLIYPYVKPTYLVCTNLFRDSLTRNAHTEFIKEFLDTSIPADTKLILNADDPISSNLAPGNERIFFGIDKQSFEQSEEPNLSCDLRICPECSSLLQYDFRRYHHIGRVHCPNCDFSTPSVIQYRAESIDEDNMTMTVREADGVINTYNFPNKNIINIYNYLAAVSFARYFGVPHDTIMKSRISVVGSRYSEASIGGKEILMTLSKAQNPIACSRAFSYAKKLQGTKSVVLLLDEIEGVEKSPENVCWMYDADFELLNSPDIIQVVAVGARHLDDAVRLLVAGVPEEVITTTDDYSSVADLINTTADKIVVLYDLHCVKVARDLKTTLTEKFKEGQ
ncbi:MAG: DUF1727 domain-containing protein [Clostridia bacterium]|nr:DUF1727 domain-containing protein [Clostridia bacterium]